MAYFTVVNKNLIVIPVTLIEDFGNLLSTVFRDPNSDKAIKSLKEKLIMVKKAGWIKSVSLFTNAPKDGGETLEKFLGVPVNNLKPPIF